MQQSTLSVIRGSISERLGKNVQLTCRSRRKETILNGVLDGAYASLFTVTVLIDNKHQRLSYTYADVLTNAVSLKSI